MPRLADVDIVTMRVRWSPKANSLVGKMRILVRFGTGFGVPTNEYLVAEFTGEDLLEIATQAAAWILEVATG